MAIWEFFAASGAEWAVLQQRGRLVPLGCSRPPVPATFWVIVTCAVLKDQSFLILCYSIWRLQTFHGERNGQEFIHTVSKTCDHCSPLKSGIQFHLECFGIDIWIQLLLCIPEQFWWQKKHLETGNQYYSYSILLSTFSSDSSGFKLCIKVWWLGSGIPHLGECYSSEALKRLGLAAKDEGQRSWSTPEEWSTVFDGFCHVQNGWFNSELPHQSGTYIGAMAGPHPKDSQSARDDPNRMVSKGLHSCITTAGVGCKAIGSIKLHWRQGCNVIHDSICCRSLQIKQTTTRGGAFDGTQFAGWPKLFWVRHPWSAFGSIWVRWNAKKAMEGKPSVVQHMPELPLEQRQDDVDECGQATHKVSHILPTSYDKYEKTRASIAWLSRNRCVFFMFCMFFMFFPILCWFPS